MSRQEKKTRMRLLPPKVQLQQQDALTGSYPTNVRFSLDGRIGNYNVNFDDAKTVDFVSIAQNSVTTNGTAKNLGLDYNPLALYTFDGNINDQSGNGYNLSLHSGSLQYTNGPYNGSQAVLFDGYNSLSSSIIPALQISGPVTIEAVIKPKQILPVISIVGYIVAGMSDIGESLTTNTLYSIGVSGDFKIGSVGYALEKGAGLDKLRYTISNVVSPGNWYHVAITRNGSGINKIYLNGVLFDTYTEPTYPAKAGGGNTQRLHVGTIPNTLGNYGEFAFRGAVSNLKIVDRELTADEVKSEYGIVFPSGILAGIGFPIQSNWVENRPELDLPTSGGISVTGQVRSQVIEGLPFFHFTPGQEIQPFSDQLQYAADAKGASVQNPFFATGSAETLVGEGFNSPLWSKNKIEIPIPVATEATFEVAYQNISTQRSPMGYYNFETNNWDPVGLGVPLGLFPGTGPAARQFNYELYPIGFPQSLFPSAIAKLNDIHNMAYCTDGMGFPFHPKFHATSSQTLDMSKYINEPFLLEKAVLQLGEVSYQLGKIDHPIITGIQPVSASVTTFFLLNQRYNQNFSYSQNYNGLLQNYSVSTVVPQSRIINYAFDFEYVDTIRDVIGFSQLFSIPGNTPLSNINVSFGGETTNLSSLLPITSNDIVVRSQVPNYLGVQYFNIKPVFSMSMCTPTIGNNLIGTDRLLVNIAPPLTYIFGNNGYRNGLGMIQPTTRGQINDLFVGKNLEPAATSLIKNAFDINITWPEEKFKANPYLLNPKDKLILGVQMPISSGPGVYLAGAPEVESKLTLHETVSKNIPAKLVLYGSYIREGREYNDGTNQLLSSETIHEVIE